METLCFSVDLIFINTAVREPEIHFFCQVERFGWGRGGLNFKGSREWKLMEVKVTIMKANGVEEL